MYYTRSWVSLVKDLQDLFISNLQIPAHHLKTTHIANKNMNIYFFNITLALGGQKEYILPLNLIH